MFLGELFALLSAGFWAACNFAFAKNMEIFSPMMFNFIKCFITSIVIILLLILLQIELPSENVSPYLSLALSGLCGIAIGDTFYLNAVQQIGARKTLLMESLAPPFTGLIAFIYSGSTISFIGWLGIGATLYGLYLVVTDQQDEDGSNTSLPTQMDNQYTNEIPLVEVSQTHGAAKEQVKSKVTSMKIIDEQNSFSQIFSFGVLNGIAAMFCQSLGMVLSYSALSEGEFDSLLATFIRLFASVLMLLPMLKYWKKESFAIPKLSVKETSFLVTIVLVSTLICIYFQQLSLVYSRPEISQTLLATSTLFGLIFGKFRGEHISRKQTMGSIIAFIGVGVIVWS